MENTFKCNQCENSFKSENGLKIHIGRAHKVSDRAPEQLRDLPPALKPFSMPPIQETRMIPCDIYFSKGVKCQAMILNSEEELTLHKETVHPLPKVNF